MSPDAVDSFNASPAVQPAPAAAPSTPLGAVGKEAFLAAHQHVTKITVEIVQTLDSVNDEATARAAAPKLAELTGQWKNAAESATAVFLTLSDEQRDAVFMEASQASAPFMANLQTTQNSDPTEQVQRIAAAAYAGAIQRELIALRDAWLTTRGSYSPVLFRRKIEEKLGPVGSPIKPE
jgi:hypothetical protein